MELHQIVPEGLPVPPREYSPLALAFVGDAVYELYVRTQALAAANAGANALHRQAVAYVKAAAQAAAAKKLQSSLSEEELAAFKRGRNAKSPTVPKNANVTDYRYATALEALFGYLYLCGRGERLLELMRLAFEASASD